MLASRAYWLLLLMIGPLVGQAFITAVDSYAEASGIAGGPAALAQGLSPLDGVLVPTFGSYDLAVTLLFPFVAIRMVSAEKESGALKLLLQTAPRLGTMLAMKGLVLLIGWLLAWTPGLMALILWKIYGGSLYVPELLNLLSGHLLRAILASGVAVAAAAIAQNAASAAIVTLGFTVGSWALDFIAQGRSGLIQKIASYTPTAALHSFEQGELRVNTLLVSLTLGLAGFIFADLWLAPGRTLAARLKTSLVAAFALATIVWVASLPASTWDLSENRRNSFPAADEAALRQIREPLHIRVFLAAEDPRLTDLDRNILSKLRRIVPNVAIGYSAHTRAGLFEGSADHYGEVWYEIGERKVMTRSTTEPIVLETLYQLAHVHPPAGSVENGFQGHPLPVHPRGAAWVFFGLYPLSVLAAWWSCRRGLT